MKYKILAFIAALMLAAPLYAADKLPDGEDTGALITLKEALSRALDNSHELRALESGVEAQKKVTDFAPYEVNNPELRFQDISTRYIDNNEGDNQQFQIGLRWQPPRLGELGQNEQRQRVELWKMKTEAEDARLALIAKIQRKYAELLMLQNEKKLAARQAGLERRRYETVKKLIDGGQKALSDGVKARRRSLKADMERERILKKYESSRRRFAALLGINGNLRVAGIETPLDMPSAAELKHKVSEGARVELGRQRAELVERRYKAERYRLIPWFSFIEAAYHYESEKRDWGELMLGIEIPLFNWNLGQLRATGIQRDNAGELKQSSIEGVNGKLDAALAKYEQSVAEYRTLKDEAEESLAQSEALADEARRQLMPEDEIIDMEISDNEMKHMLEVSAYAVAESAIEVCRASGDAECLALKDRRGAP